MQTTRTVIIESDNGRVPKRTRKKTCRQASRMWANIFNNHRRDYDDARRSIDMLEMTR